MMNAATGEMAEALGTAVVTAEAKMGELSCVAMALEKSAGEAKLVSPRATTILKDTSQVKAPSRRASPRSRRATVKVTVKSRTLLGFTRV